MRIKRNELSIGRVYAAGIRRIEAIPFKLSWTYSKKGKENRMKLRKFKNSHKGERCFLVANGPSLKNMSLDFLKDEISFGLNRIYLAFEDMNFETDYLVSINDLVLEQFREEIQSLPMPKFLNWQQKANYKDDNTFFIYKSFGGKSFGRDISKSLNPAATVTYAALQIIHYMGFKEVVIIGLDHNFQTKNSNRPNKTEIREEEKDVNHFHPDYFPKGSKWQTPDLYSSEYFYRIAKKEFELDGKRIIDCTIGGKCQIFDKGDIQNFISTNSTHKYK